MPNQNICRIFYSNDQTDLRTIHFVFEKNSPQIDAVGKHHHHALYLVTGGDAIFRTNGKRWPITVGTIFITFAGYDFTFENANHLEYCYVSFTGERADRLFRRFGMTPASCVFDGYEGLIPFWQDNLLRADEENSDLLSESVLLYTLSRIRSARKPEDDLVVFVLEYLDEHFMESGLTLSEVAEVAGYHEKYLSYTFKKRFGMGFSKYLRVLRMKYAVALLENGVTSVKNLAALSGFSDPLYFSRVFTETMGVSPSQYRKTENDTE